jgi:hypothetical protein
MFLEIKRWISTRSKAVRLFIYSIFIEIFIYIFSLAIIFIVNRHTSKISTFIIYLHTPGLYVGKLMRYSIGYFWGDWLDFVELLIMIAVQSVLLCFLIAIIQFIVQRFRSHL